jgi:hypothetical protein
MYKLYLVLFLLVFQSFALSDFIFKNGFEDGFIFYSGFEQLTTCQNTNDDDSDGLLNCYETNTQIYVDQFDTGTDPNNPDTEGDALSDGDEVLGTVNGLDLPAMGTNPLVRNILLEYDWFDDNLDPGTCSAHSHRPTANAINQVALAFLNAPNVNPDGSSGIVVIQDYGQGGVFSQGTLLNDADGVLTGGVSGTEFAAYKSTDFDSNREGYFHYVILPHRYNTDSNSSGQAEINGDDMIVSLYCYGSDSNVSHTILHELGHNLSLRHGGLSNCNYKPNYNSVMNYAYQFPGADNNCDGVGNGVLDYSRGANVFASLDELSLNESIGICNNQPIDWNGNNVIDGSNVSADINGDSLINSCHGEGPALHDYNDWSFINFSGVQDADRPGVEIINCTNPAPEN